MGPLLTQSPGQYAQFEISLMFIAHGVQHYKLCDKYSMQIDEGKNGKTYFPHFLNLKLIVHLKPLRRGTALLILRVIPFSNQCRNNTHQALHTLTHLQQRYIYAKVGKNMASDAKAPNFPCTRAR